MRDAYLPKYSLNKLQIRELSPHNPYDKFQTIEVSIGNLVLNKLLPDFWSIVQSPKNRIYSDPERRRIVIPTDYFKSQGNVFSLLHEIGHAILDESESEEDIEEEIFLRDKYCQLGPEALSPMEKSKFNILVIGSEKFAWNWAIQTVIEYRKKSVDFEPLVSVHDLTRIANKKLVSYLR